MGAAMGAGVGLTMGFLFGSFSILRYVLACPRVVPSAHYSPEEAQALAECFRRFHSTCLEAPRHSRSSLPLARYENIP